jgi:hypothetical protein
MFWVNVQGLSELRSSYCLEDATQVGESELSVHMGNCATCRYHFNTYSAA